MKRLSVAMVALLSAIGCGASPTGPDGGFTVTVTVLDEVTSQPIVDQSFGVSVRLGAAGAQAAANGKAVISGIASGTYRLTTEIDYGYTQLDLISVTVDASKAVTLRLKPIDDLAVTEVFVEGQGLIAKGGAFDVPAEGVTLRYRGRYQSIKYPWPSLLLIQPGTTASNGQAFGGGTRASSVQVSATDWEYTYFGWKPCDGATCRTSSEFVNLYMAKVLGSPFNQDALMNKQQRWPMTFRLPAGLP